MMILQSDMNSAATQTDLATSNVQYHGNQAGMNITGDGHNPSLLSGSNPIQHQRSAANILDLMMIEELLNPVCYNNQAPPQPMPSAFPSTLPIGYQNNMRSQLCYNISGGPARAPFPAPASMNPNPAMPCINNNAASLMPSNGNPDDIIGFEQFLVALRVVNPSPRNPSSVLSNALTAAPIPNQIIQSQGQHYRTQTPTSSFPNNFAGNQLQAAPIPNQIIQTQGQHFLPQTHNSSVVSNAANDGAAEEAMQRRMRKMMKNRDSAARSRARTKALIKELQNQVDRLTKENEMLKRMLEVKIETNNGDKKLKRTRSWN